MAQTELMVTMVLLEQPPGGWVRDSSYAVDDGSAAAMHVSIALLHTAEAEAALEAVFNAVSEPGNKVRWLSIFLHLCNIPHSIYIYLNVCARACLPACM